MKQLNSTIRILLVCTLITLMLPRTGYAALNGSYTINPTKAASSSNYKDWASAVNDLLNGSRSDGGTAQGSGVNGPVVFTVYDTIYGNTSLHFTAISGTSFSNTITFKSAGGNNTKCMLKYDSKSSNSDDYVVFLDGSDYISFQNIGFERTTGSAQDYYSVIQINDANKSRFIGCYMKGLKKNSSSSLTFTNGPGSCIYFVGATDSAEITNCRVLYGFNGIFNASTGTANHFTGNTIDTSGCSGMYLTNQADLKIKNNTFNMGDFGTGKGHAVSYAIRAEYAPSIEISGNKIYMLAINATTCRAIVLANCNSKSSNPAMVFNNWIVNSGGSGSCTGLAVYEMYYLNFYYNNVLIINSSTASAAYFQYGTYSDGNLNLKYNNFVNKGSGTAVDIQDNTNYAAIDSMDYNTLYSAGTNIANWRGTLYSTIAGFRTASGKAANSLQLDPGYISKSDLHVSNIAINGKALPDARIIRDIDGDSRDASTPDIGADEFFPIANDAGIANVDSPSLFCAGKHPVKVTFQNYGYDTIKSVEINWQVNGVTQTSNSWTGKLAPGVSSASVNLGNYSFAANTAYTIKVWTKSPNNASDGKNINDTLSVVKYAALSGNYTIGDTSIANYKAFNSAIADMAKRGVCGAVTFNVFPGTYTEQLGLLNLPGMGASSPITFQNITSDSTRVKITLGSATPNGVNNATLQLRGASYVTFKGITFERTGSLTYAYVLHILNGSHHNSFINCQMLGILNSSFATHTNIWSDQSADNYNTFRGNYIKGGLYNLQFTNTASDHERGTVIENNTFESSYNSPIQLALNDKIVIRGNTFLNGAIANTANADVQIMNSDSGIIVENNVFRDANAGSAVSLNTCHTKSGEIAINKNIFMNASANDILIKRCDSSLTISYNQFRNTNVNNSISMLYYASSASKPSRIFNNIFTRSGGKGIMVDSSSNIEIIYNSLNFTSGSGTNTGINTGGANSNISLMNNNIVMQSGEALHVTFGSEIKASSNNNLYTKGSDFVYWGGGYGNLADLVTGSGMQANSFSVNPMYTSSTDLHMRNPLLKGQGTPVAGITTDFEGEARSSTKPDIGADEFKLSANDAGITELVNPVAGTCAGKLNLEVVIRNFGNDTLKNAVITWKAQNVAQTPYNWTGSLPTGASDTFMIGSFNFLSVLNPKFEFVSTMPNGQADGIDFNDTLITNRSIRALPTAYAGPDRTICFGDTLNIGGNSNGAFSYKWMTLSGITLGTNSRLNIKPGAQTSYVLEVTNTAFGCKKNDTTVVNVNALPAVNAGTDQNVCPGSSAQIGSTAQSGVTYSWTSSPAGFVSTTADPSVTPGVSTEYYVRATNTTTGCKNSDTVEVGLSAVPTANITGVSSVCDGELQSFSTIGATGNTYNWKVTGGAIEGSQIGNSIDVRWNVPGTGTIEVIETNASTCKDTNSVNVTVNANPTAAFTATTACFGTATTFTNTSTGATSYDWAFGDGATSTLKDPTHIYPTALNYNPKLIVKSSAGCADTTTIQVSTSPLPLADFTFTRQPNRTYSFDDGSTVTGGTITEWMWDFGDGDSSDVENPTHHFLVGSYTVKLCSKSAAGCETCVTKNLNVVGVDQVAFDKNLFVMPNPGSGIFTINSSRTMERMVITNAMGQVLQTISPDNNNIRIDLTSEPAGIYFIRVELDGQSSILKLIKQ